MRNFTIAIAVLLAVSAAAQGAEEIAAGKCRVKLAEVGFLATASIGEHVVADQSAKKGFRGVILDCFQPCEQEQNPAIAAVGKTIPGKVAGAKTSKSGREVKQETTVKAGPVTGKFELAISPAKDKPTLVVDCQVLLEGDGLVSAVGLAVPLLAGDDEYLRKTTVGSGNAQRVMESWRLNQNRRQRGWPPWTLGGLSVPSSNYYLIWKASRRDTPAMRMDEGRRCPGWLDYSQKLWGLTVIWKEIHKSAPAAMWMEADTGTLRIFLHPPSTLPLHVRGRAKLSAQIELAFHEGPHPVTVKQELSDQKYSQLLGAMDDGSRYTFLAKTLSAFNCRTADDLLCSNVQPSAVLAMEGRANYRIQALCKKLQIPFDRGRAKSEPRKYGEELIHTIIARLGGRTSFRF